MDDRLVQILAEEIAADAVSHPMFFHKNNEIKLNRYEIIRDIASAAIRKLKEKAND